LKLCRAFVVDDTALVSSNVAETEAAWLVGTTYASGNVVRRTVDGVHRRFASAINSNVGNDPALLDPSKWTDQGPTNRWKMLDQRLQLQTANPDTIYKKIQVVGRISVVYVGNVAGQTLRVVCTDAIDGVVYDKTVNLVSTSGITDWARWFREPITPLRDKGLTDLPSGYSDLLVEVTIDNTGATALCGELTTGLLADLGGTKYGGKLGTTSYSRLGDDTFGDDFLIKRGKKRTGAFDILVDNRHLDEVTTLLDDLDATAVLFVANERYAAMFIFGVLLDWSQTVSWPTRTALSVNLQSFTRT
jgi:hypothetical protein